MIPNIVNSIGKIGKHKSVTDRYFTRRYCLNVDNIKNNDYMVLFHSNRITILTLAPSHFFYDKEIDYKINFSSGNVDRLKNSVRGKGKKGGQTLGPNSVLCRVEYSDGTSFPVPSCLAGTLVEINEELLKNPQLLRNRSDSEGFIAIILSKIEISKAAKDHLMTHEEYVKLKRVGK